MQYFRNHLRRTRRGRRGGFTLIEAAMTTLIVGVGFMAMMQLIATGSVVAATLAQKNPGKVEKKFVIRDSPAHIGVRRGEPDVVAWLNVFIYYHRKPGGELDALARKWFGEPLPIDPTL